MMFLVGKRPGETQILLVVSGHAPYIPSERIYVYNQLCSILVACPKCDNDRAYFYQLQIRSADEPMTTCTFFDHTIDSSYPLVTTDIFPYFSRSLSVTNIRAFSALLANILLTFTFAGAQHALINGGTANHEREEKGNLV